ncbi:hypothetical protein [Nocardiopsis halophila]|uniref:hypothetical protein n=1 Tax=Nocardiopsis halophila TaxID=141692 RepID=UPI00034CAB24|nr:hypothetical protein [Nocardiopsis halophila]
MLLGTALHLVLMSEGGRRDQHALDAAMGRIAGSAVEFVEGISVPTRSAATDVRPSTTGSVTPRTGTSGPVTW